MVLGNQLYMALLKQGVLNQMTSRGCFQPQPFCEKGKSQEKGGTKVVWGGTAIGKWRQVGHEREVCL